MNEFLENFLNDDKIKKISLNSQELSQLLYDVSVAESEDEVTKAFINYIIKIENKEKLICFKLLTEGLMTDLNQIKERYSEPHRFYHTWKHIEYMLKTGQESGINFEDEYKNENLLHLIYCHDVIYIPGNLDNEELSGKSAVEFYEQLCNEYEKEHNPPDNPFQELISFDYTPHTLYPIVINFTKNHIINYEELFEGFNYPEEIQHWKYTAETLIDLDLAILGDTWEVYQEYVANVRKEYAHATDEQWKQGRTEWILSMLGRESIYYTDWGKKRNQQAKDNLTHEFNILMGAEK